MVQPLPFGRDYDNGIIVLRGELAKVLLPRALNLPAGAKPKESETADTFLNRIVTEAVARQDYVLAARARSVQFSLMHTAENINQGDRARQEALDTFITAHNQEAAGQFTLAVASYEKALTKGNDLVPPKVIGERLDAIKRQHPKEFEQGFNDFVAPNNPFFGMRGGSKMEGAVTKQPVTVITRGNSDTP
jgi:hypothetical protein